MEDLILQRNEAWDEQDEAKARVRALETQVHNLQAYNNNLQEEYYQLYHQVHPVEAEPNEAAEGENIEVVDISSEESEPGKEPDQVVPSLSQDN